MGHAFGNASDVIRIKNNAFLHLVAESEGTERGRKEQGLLGFVGQFPERFIYPARE